MAIIDYGANLPPGQGIPAHLQQMFQRLDKPDAANSPYSRVGANQYGPSVKRIQKGSLIHFRYTNFKHDPYPLIIITDISANYIRGVNLHYLTFNYIKKLLGTYCDNQAFEYANIRGDAFLTNSFRTYKRAGVKQPNTLDCSFLLAVMQSVRSFDPGEVEHMRAYIKEQLKRQVNPRAQATEERYMGQVNKQAGFNQPTRAAQPPNQQFPNI